MNLPILTESRKTEKKRFEEETQKKFEAFWENFSQEGAKDQERIKRSLELIKKEKLEGEIADLGSGRGPFLLNLVERGAKVTAVDVARNALHLKDVKFVHACLPYLKFPDETFDGILLTDVIADIDTHLQRLTISEVARLLKKEGWALFSTMLDIYSEDALSQFLYLLKTEFEIVEIKHSFHRLHFYIERFLKGPRRFVQAKDAEYRRKQLEKRKGFFRLWFYMNSTPLLIFVWKPLSSLIEPVKKRFLNSEKALLFCEKVSKILWYNSAYTHVIVRARKKRLF